MLRGKYWKGPRGWSRTTASCCTGRQGWRWRSVGRAKAASAGDKISGGAVRQQAGRTTQKGRRYDMNGNNGKDNGKWDRYSGGVWSRLQETTRTIQAEYDRGGHSEPGLHRLADQLREIFGGVKVVKELIPQIMAEHKKAVEWGLERLLVAVRRLEALPYVEPPERQGIEQRIHHIIG